MSPLFKKMAYASLLLVVIAAVYGVFVSFSENHRYTKLSPEYYLLTPSVIRNQPLPDVHDVEYSYSAADGNKPVIVSMVFYSKVNQEQVMALFENYLTSLGYANEGDASSYTKPGNEVAIEYQLGEGGRAKVTLTALEFLVE